MSVDDRDDEEIEHWWCDDCEKFRPLDGSEAFACDWPRDCPRSDEWEGDNCGHVVCGRCHAPVSDSHLAPTLL